MGYIQGYGIRVFRLREAKENCEFIIYDEKTNRYNEYSYRRAMSLLIKETSGSGVNIIEAIAKTEGLKEKSHINSRYIEVFNEEYITIDNIKNKPVNCITYEEDNKIYFNPFIQPMGMNSDNYTTKITFEQLTNKAPHIYQLLANLHNNNDKAIKDTLLKIADKLLYPEEKAQDCIIFHPGEGAGKGIFFKYILQPIFKNYAKKVLMNKLANDFNAFLQDPLILVLEEGKANRQLTEILKELVTEDEILINEKGKAQRMEKIRFLTFVFSNNTNPVNLGKRRGSYHNCQPLDTIEQKCCNIGAELVHYIPRELDVLLNYLHNLDFTHEESMIPFRTKNKLEVLNQNKTGIELFFDYMTQFENIYKCFENIFGSTFNFEMNIYESKGLKYISKSIIKRAYNNFCIMEGLNHNVIRNNRDMVQLWSMLGVRDKDVKRFVITDVKNNNRKLEHVELSSLNKKIKEVYENE